MPIRVHIFLTAKKKRVRKVLFYIHTYGFNIKRKNIKERKEVLEVLIHLR